MDGHRVRHHRPGDAFGLRRADRVAGATIPIHSTMLCRGNAGFPPTIPAATTSLEGRWKEHETIWMRSRPTPRIEADAAMDPRQPADAGELHEARKAPPCSTTDSGLRGSPGPGWIDSAHSDYEFPLERKGNAPMCSGGRLRHEATPKKEPTLTASTAT